MKKVVFMVMAICMIVLFACTSTVTSSNLDKVTTPQVSVSDGDTTAISGRQLVCVTNSDGMMAAFDHQGNRLTEFEFTHFKEFNKVFVAYKGEDKYIFDYKGKSILSAPAKDIDIHEEFFYPDDILEEPKYKETMVFYKETDKWGMISVEGRPSIAPMYDNLFLYGKYYIGYKAQKAHALDMNADVVTSYYDDIDVVEGGFIVANDGKYGYISKNNKILIEPKYYLIDAIDDDKLIVITDDSKYGLYNQNGKKLLPEIYEYIWGVDFDKDYLYVKSNGKIGIYSNKGFIITPHYDDVFFVRTIDKNYWSVVKNDKHGLLYEDGRTLFPTKYSSISCYYHNPTEFDFVVGINDRFQVYSTDGKTLKNTYKTVFFDINDGPLVSWEEAKKDSLCYNNAFVHEVKFSSKR